MEMSCITRLDQWFSERGEEIRTAWLDQTVAWYSKVYRDFIQDQRNPFANPTGAILRVGIDRLFAALVEGAGVEPCREILNPMIRLKAVQDGPPSQALAFLPDLKTILHAQLRDQSQAEGFRQAMTEMERRIDAITLLAFDVYLECRETIYQLRVGEMKRSVARLLPASGERMAQPAEPLRGEDCSVCSSPGGNGS